MRSPAKRGDDGRTSQDAPDRDIIQLPLKLYIVGGQELRFFRLDLWIKFGRMIEKV